MPSSCTLQQTHSTQVKHRNLPDPGPGTGNSQVYSGRPISHQVFLGSAAQGYPVQAPFVMPGVLQFEAVPAGKEPLAADPKSKGIVCVVSKCVHLY